MVYLCSNQPNNYSNKAKMKQTNVKPALAAGKLGILVVGCGAVSTTFMTGVLLTRKGLGKPVGSFTQYDKIRVGKGADKQYLHVGDIVPLADLNDIVFGCWDVYPQNAYQAAMYAEVLKEKDINQVRDELEQIVPMAAAFDKNYAKRLDGDNVKCEMVNGQSQPVGRWWRPFARISVSLSRRNRWSASWCSGPPQQRSTCPSMSRCTTALKTLKPQ